tara:strand:+ start:344 stop:1375 length:1032 start_codon:yes stop_codon:yes gene_type:complete
MSIDYSWIGPKMAPPDIVPPLKVGIVATPNFTLMSLSCLVEYLRLAADESDFSRQIYCSWSLLAQDRTPLMSSCGLAIVPTADMSNLEQYDFVVFHGGALHSSSPVPQYIYDGIQKAVDKGVRIVGLCTGQFLLAEMGLLDNRQCAVHFSLEPVLRKHFPKVEAISTRSVVEDGPFITCPGGLAAINLGSRLVAERCGKARVEKVLQYLMASRHDLSGDAARREVSFIGAHCRDQRVVNAIGIMRQRMYERCDVSEIADQVGTTKRELTRLFNKYLRVPPAEYWRNIRLSAAHWMVVNTDRSITQIAYECGFTDSSHLIRWFQRNYKVTPTALRKTHADVSVH